MNRLIRPVIPGLAAGLLAVPWHAWPSAVAEEGVPTVVLIKKQPTVGDLFAKGALGEGWTRRSDPADASYDNETFNLHLAAEARILFHNAESVVVFDEGPAGTPALLSYRAAGKKSPSAVVRFEDGRVADVRASYSQDPDAQAEGISPVSVAVLLSQEGVPFQGYLMKKLGLSAPSLEEIAGQRELDRRLERRGRALREMVRRTRAYREAHPRPAMRALSTDVVDVMQNQAGITRDQAGLERYVQTFGAGPCIIVTVYERPSRTAALAHIQPGTSIGPSIDAMISRMGPAGAGVEARIIGGGEGAASAQQAGDMIEAFRRHGASVVEVDLTRSFGAKSAPAEGGAPPPPQDDSDAIVIDARTGEVYNMVGTPAVDAGRVRRNAMLAELAMFQKTPVEFVRAGLLRAAAAP
ncbi:MAG: hypothetical protein HY927_15995 [Elusimicrobia bacterium]|nr:hypothetical protein [Elusimicrobiota bacterium]